MGFEAGFVFFSEFFGDDEHGAAFGGFEFGFLEIGCGKTLTGLNKKIGVAQTASIETVGDLEVAYAMA